MLRDPSYTSDPILINNIESDKIKNIECGSEHVCYMTEKGQVGCVEGSDVSREAELTNEMTTGVLKIYAGK